MVIHPLCDPQLLQEFFAFFSGLPQLPIFSLLGSSLSQSLKCRGGEEFKRNINSLDKDHAKEFKKVHHSIKRKLDFLRKLERRKGGGKETAAVAAAGGGLRKEPVSIAGQVKALL